MIKLAVFDLDGTLINSIEDLADAVNRALFENGYKNWYCFWYYFSLKIILKSKICRKNERK